MMIRGDNKRDISFFGRTIYDEQTDAVFFNWTGAGFEAAFEGTRFEATLLALQSSGQPEGKLWPCVSVFLDDGEAPVCELLLERPEQRYTLFESDSPERHRIRVVKRTENEKGKAGVKSVAVEGVFLPVAPRENKPRIELIGDSITCGFGNEAAERDGQFLPEEQNGHLAYGAVAARLLGAEYHSISVSGISLCAPLEPDFSLEIPGLDGFRLRVKAMEDYYAFTDRSHEEARGVTSGFSAWDFGRFRPDAIVINLGTNDSYRIKAAKDKQAEIAHFELRYAAFLQTIRQRNGAAPVICCTLGPMDYFLYDNIVSAVRTYQSRTGDERIFCYKFGGIYPLKEGFGAGDHPSIITHRRMGEELSWQLRPWLEQV